MFKKEKKTTLSLKTVFGYAVGELGYTFFLIYIAYYLMYFLTDVLNFSTSSAAVIYTACQWFEVITVLICGIVISKKNLLYTKWMMIGAVICWIFTSLFFIKFNIPAQLYVLLFSLFYIIAYSGYNLMWISYRSLLGVLSKVPYDTVMLSTTGSQFGTVASILFSYFGIKILIAFSSNPAIYAIDAFVYCGIMVLCMFFVYATSKPYDRIELERKQQAAERITLKQMFSAFKGPMIPFFISVSLRSSVSVVISTLMIYYLRYVIGDTGLMPTYVALVSIAALLGAISAQKITRVMDKKTLYLITAFINIVLLLFINLFGKSSVGFIVLMTVNSFFMFLGNVLVPVFINDIADYHLYKTNVDIRAFTFSVGALSVHAAQIIGSGIASFGLVLFRYVSDSAISSVTVKGIQYLLSYVSPTIILLGAVALLFYRLDENAMQKIHSSIKEKSV